METLLKKIINFNKELSEITQMEKSIEYIGYDKIAKAFVKTINSNIFIIDLEGRLLGVNFYDQDKCLLFSQIIEAEKIANKKIINMLKNKDLKTSVIYNNDSICNFFDEQKNCVCTAKNVMIVPVYRLHEKIGAVIVFKFNDSFEEDDVYLAEYMSIIIALKMQLERTQKISEETKNKSIVQVTLSKMSFTELKSIISILDELKTSVGIIKLGKLAEQIGANRTSMMNATQKLEAAGLISTKSLGRKGTWVKIINPCLDNEIKKFKRIAKLDF